MFITIQIKKFNDKGILINLKNKYGELSLNYFNDNITVFMYDYFSIRF